MRDDAIERAADLLWRQWRVDTGQARKLVAQQVQLMQLVLADMEKLQRPRGLRDKLEQLAEAAAKFGALDTKTERLVENFIRWPGEAHSLAKQMKGIASSLKIMAASLIVPPGSRRAPLSSGFAVLAAANITREILNSKAQLDDVAFAKAIESPKFQELVAILCDAIVGRPDSNVAGQLKHQHQIRAYRKGALDLNQWSAIVFRMQLAEKRRRK